MKIIIVKGTLETLGESIKKDDSIVKYDYLSFRQSDGSDLMVKNIQVWDEVNRIIYPGANGIFIIAKVAGPKELHAVKIGDREAYSEFIRCSLGSMYVKLIIPWIFYLLLCFLVVGIPLIILLSWTMICMPTWKKQLLSVLRQEGFTINKVTVI